MIGGVIGSDIDIDGLRGGECCECCDKKKGGRRTS
jgi:hypothetical protein